MKRKKDYPTPLLAIGVALASIAGLLALFLFA